MKKILVVAHPDDEILWFNPYDFDKIYICFCGRSDKQDFKRRRLSAVGELPYRDKIILLGFNEGDNFCFPYELNADEIWTHNSNGEYGHKHHIQINKMMHNLFGNKVRESNMDNTNCKEDWFLKAKEVYLKNGCWTWKK